MKIISIGLPAIALGGAALLLLPAPASHGFTTLGGTLGDAQRDVRLFDNFADAASNNNTTADPQFPGYTGAEMAVWKGVVEWGSEAHGDGSGDPTQSTLGNGGANFDAAWMGNASGVGTSNDNIASTISSCSGSTLAYTETPISNGWRIRYCDGGYTWSDGPGSTTGGQWDIQGIMVHEFGHALGLGHSSSGGATMFASASGSGNSNRQIQSDDIAGVQFLYGVKSSGKPHISSLSLVGSTLTISGSGFSTSGNEVWFTNGSTSSTGGDPRVRVTGVGSTGGGTSISVTVPASAGSGDVLVKDSGSGGAALSNAFPFDSQGGSSGCAHVQFGLGLGGPNIGALSSASAPQIGTLQSISVSNFNGASSGTFVLSRNQVSQSFKGGTRLVDFATTITQFAFSTSAAGTATINFSLPNNPGLVGRSFYQQVFVVDATQTQGFALSNGLSATICQ